MFHAGSTLAARLEFNVYLVRSQAGECVKHSLRPSMPLFLLIGTFPDFFKLLCLNLKTNVYLCSLIVLTRQQLIQHFIL